MEIINEPKYYAGMKAERYKNDGYGYHDPACYGLMHILGGACRVRCDLRKLCKSKSLINKRKEMNDEEND